MDCCGNVGPKDYVLPPNSCYNSESDKLSLEGCRQKFLDYIADSWTAFNIVSLVLVGVEVRILYCNMQAVFLQHENSSARKLYDVTHLDVQTYL